jgi:hypothetical protein
MSKQPEMWPPTPQIKPIKYRMRYLDDDGLWKERDATEQETRELKRK